MKPRISYKYVDTRMFIRLIISNRRSTSAFMFFLEVVLFVGAVRNNQQLHYQAQRLSTKVKQSLHVK